MVVELDYYLNYKKKINLGLLFKFLLLILVLLVAFSSAYSEDLMVKDSYIKLEKVPEYLITGDAVPKSNPKTGPSTSSSGPSPEPMGCGYYANIKNLYADPDPVDSGNSFTARFQNYGTDSPYNYQYHAVYVDYSYVGCWYTSRTSCSWGDYYVSGLSAPNSQGTYQLKIKSYAYTSDSGTGCYLAKNSPDDYDIDYFSVQSSCSSTWLNNYRCNGINTRERLYQSSDCSTQWNFWQNCESSSGYGGWVEYCASGNEKWKKRMYTDYDCISTSCQVDWSNWVDHTFVTDCDWSDGWACSGNTKQYRNYGCSGSGSCTYSVTSSHNCDNDDGWYCTNSNTGSEYRNYGCSSGSCAYSSSNGQSCAWGCNTGTGQCNSQPPQTFDITNVVPESGTYDLDNTYSLTIYYNANFNGNAQIAADFIRGTSPNCYKLHCANPAGDSECNSGCQTGSLKPISVSSGSHSVTVQVDLPSNGQINGDDDNFVIKLGAWKTPYTDSYDFYTVGSTKKVTCHRGQLGGLDWLSNSCKGDLNEGDCDGDSECKGSHCAVDVGPSYGWESTVDVCQIDCSSQNQCVSNTELHKNSYYNIGSQSCSYDIFNKPNNGWSCSGDGYTKFYTTWSNCDSATLSFPSSQSNEYNCQNDNTETPTDYCSGDLIKRDIYYEYYGCSSGSCSLSDTDTATETLDNCNSYDGWVCDGDDRKYKNYGCSSATCTYTYTQTEACSFGCDDSTATCNKIDITDVQANSTIKLGEVLDINVDADSYNIDNNVIFLVDVVRDTGGGNCEKLFCGEPDSDTECGAGGCISGDIPPAVFVSHGQNLVNLPILLPLIGTPGDYQVVVSAYKPLASDSTKPDYTQQYDSFIGGIVQVTDPCSGVTCPDTCSGGSKLYNGYCDAGACVYESANCADMDGFICNDGTSSVEERSYFCSSGSCQYNLVSEEACTFGCYSPTVQCKEISIDGVSVEPAEAEQNSYVDITIDYTSIGIFGDITFSLDLINGTSPDCIKAFCVDAESETECSSCESGQPLVFNTSHGANSYTVTIPIVESVMPVVYDLRAVAWQTPYSINYSELQAGTLYVFESNGQMVIGFMPTSGSSDVSPAVASGKGINLVVAAATVITAVGASAIGISIARNNAVRTESKELRRIAKSFDNISKTVFKEQIQRPTLAEVLSGAKAKVVGAVNIISQKARDFLGVKPFVSEKKWYAPNVILPPGFNDGVYAGKGSAIPQAYLDQVSKYEEEKAVQEREEMNQFKQAVRSMSVENLRSLSESDRIWLFGNSTEYGMSDNAAIFGSRDSLNSYIDAISPPPPKVENRDISNAGFFGSLAKIGRGWKYKFEGAWDWMKGAASGAGNFIGNAVDTLKKDPFAPFKSIANGIGNFMKDPIGNTVSGLKAVGGFVVNSAGSYVNALINNPFDTLAKTAIVIGGVALAIPSGGTSLAAAGALLAGAGAVTMFAQESHEFVTAKTESELKRKAQEDIDDLLWIGGGFLTSFQAAKIANVARVDKMHLLPKDKLGNLVKKRFKIRNWDDDPAAVYRDTRNKLHYFEATDHPLMLKHGNAIRAHEFFGEAAIHKGIVKAPNWIGHDPVLGDIAADLAASRFVGWKSLEKAGHNWFKMNKPYQYFDDLGRKHILTKEVAENVAKNTKIPWWYSRAAGNYIPPILAGEAAYKSFSANKKSPNKKWLSLMTQYDKIKAEKGITNAETLAAYNRLFNAGYDNEITLTKKEYESLYPIEASKYEKFGGDILRFHTYKDTTPVQYNRGIANPQPLKYTNPKTKKSIYTSDMDYANPRDRPVSHVREDVIPALKGKFKSLAHNSFTAVSAASSKLNLKMRSLFSNAQSQIGIKKYKIKMKYKFNKSKSLFGKISKGVKSLFNWR